VTVIRKNSYLILTKGDIIFFLSTLIVTIFSGFQFLVLPLIHIRGLDLRASS